jgi:hypothetical protein
MAGLATRSTTMRSKLGWPFSEMSLATATTLGEWANFTLILSLVVGVVSTFLIYKTSGIKENAWDRLRLEQEVRIKQLDKEAREAERQAEAERLERVKLQEKISWRTLNTEQKNRIVSKISSFAGQQYILGVSSDPESVNFLKTIEEILDRAKAVRLRPTGQLISPDHDASIAMKSEVVVMAAPSRLNVLGPKIIEFAKALSDEGIASNARYNLELETSPEVLSI